jgi:hypothetical protein
VKTIAGQTKKKKKKKKKRKYSGWFEVHNFLAHQWFLRQPNLNSGGRICGSILATNNRTYSDLAKPNSTPTLLWFILIYYYNVCLISGK